MFFSSGRQLLQFLWGSAFGKLVKWQKINGEHFPIFQKQSPSAALLKRCFSFLKKDLLAHVTGVSLEEVFCFIIKTKRFRKRVFCCMKIWRFSCLQCPKCLVMIELSCHQYKESSNEMPIKALLQNDFLNS